MNKNLVVDVNNSGMTEKGEHAIVMIALCNLQEYKELTQKIKEDNIIEAKF